MIPQWQTPSGNLTIVQENTSFTYFLNFSMVPAGQIEIVSGSLPDGVIIDKNTGTISGTPNHVNQTTVSTFVLRLHNSDGFSDRSFSITVINQQPTWLTPSVILEYVPPEQDYRNRQVIEYQLKVTDPGNTVTTYELIGGKLPDGVHLRSDGLITGYIKDSANIYEFTVRANTSTPIEKTFILRILDDSTNRPPFWSTLPGWLGDIREGVFFGFNLTGDDSDNNPVTFSLKPGEILPSGISLQSNGWLAGTLDNDITIKQSFIVLISDGNRTIERKFFLRCNYSLEDDDLIIIPPINPNDPQLLGILEQDEFSWFNISAINTSSWVRYELSSGSLPTGLTINQVTGDIEGTVDISVVPNIYNFTIRAYNNILLEDFIDLKIEVKPRMEIRQNRVSMIVTGYERRKMQNFYHNYVIEYEKLFRPADKNFGMSIGNEIRFKKYVDFNHKNDLFLILENMKHIEGHSLNFITTPVLTSQNNYICDSVIMLFKDDNEKAAKQINYNGQIIKNASMDIIRTALEDDLNAPKNSFENWQTGFYNTNISNNTFISQNHDLYSGKIVVFKKQDIPSPFLNDFVYYAIVKDKNTFQLATTLQTALAGDYVRFNINDVNRPGYYYTHHNAVPIAYVKRGEGLSVVQKLNNAYQDTNIKIDLNHVVFGKTNEDDMEMMVFDGGPYGN